MKGHGQEHDENLSMNEEKAFLPQCDPFSLQVEFSSLTAETNQRLFLDWSQSQVAPPHLKLRYNFQTVVDRGDPTDQGAIT